MFLSQRAMNRGDSLRLASAAVAAAEENQQGNDDDPNAVVVEEIAEAVVIHIVVSFQGERCPLLS